MKSSKCVLVTMRDASQWLVPAELVAHDRALNYESEDAPYAQTFTETMRDSGELLEWARNNMNWEDVEKYAALYIPTPPLDYEDKQEGWVEGENEVIDTPAEYDFDLPESEIFNA